ncbi:MAG TPA: hypothetical protein VN577_21005 [Terriglobales bacterium]|nr:hypothetical protein [Terriglobales bacterium]
MLELKNQSSAITAQPAPGDRRSFFRLTKQEDGWISSGTPHCLLSQHSHASAVGSNTGAFAQWNWDGSELAIKNDRLGFMPLFYYATPTDFCVSGSIPVLLQQGAPTNIDYDALGIYLRTGYFLANDTAFEAIKLVPPSAQISWRDGKLSVSGSAPIPASVDVSRKDALDGCISLVRQAVMRTAPSDQQFAVTLSGGRDSRHILLELLSCGFKPSFCATARYFDCWPTNDIEIAAELCRRSNIPHHVVGQDSSMLTGQLEKNIRTSFGTTDHVWIPPLVRFLKSRTNTVYEGVACDVFTGTFSTPKRLAYMRAHQFEKFADDVLELDDKAIRALVGEDNFRRMNREAAVARVAKEAEKYADAGNPVALYFIFNRTRRVTSLAPMNLLIDVGNVITPYLDFDVFSFLCGCPGEMFVDHTFHTEAITLAYPEFADVPYASPATSRTVRIASSYKFFAGIALDLASFSLDRSRKPQLVDRGFLWPRLLRSLVDWNYSEAMAWISELAILLIHLEFATLDKLLDVSEFD